MDWLEYENKNNQEFNLKKIDELKRIEFGGKNKHLIISSVAHKNTDLLKNAIWELISER